jgi:hypothetical protein
VIGISPMPMASLANQALLVAPGSLISATIGIEVAAI